MKEVVLFTEIFPYSALTETQFITPELKVLLTTFEKVYLIPEIKKGALQFSSSGNLIVVEEFAKEKKYDKKIAEKVKEWCNAVFTGFFIQTICTTPLILVSFTKLKILVRSINRIKRLTKNVETFIVKYQIDINKTIFYTYWFEAATSALAQVKKKYPGLNIISRGHGFDIYDDRVKYRSAFIREFTIQRMRGLFTVSLAGSVYLKEKFPAYSDKIYVSYLGIEDSSNTLSRPSIDNVFRIVSCSRLVPVKRVPLLYYCIEAYALKNKNRQVEWHHFGDGEEMENVRQLVNQNKLQNYQCILHGETPNEDIRAFYEKNAVDMFATVSQSEGIPVSIMEAQSFGIPVIATNVGGIPEIIHSEVGILISGNPTPDEFSEKLTELINSKGQLDQMRLCSRLNFEQHFNANTNHSRFARQIASF